MVDLSVVTKSISYLNLHYGFFKTKGFNDMQMFFDAVFGNDILHWYTAGGMVLILDGN